MALNLPAAVQPGGAAMLPPQASDDNQAQDFNARSFYSETRIYGLTSSKLNSLARALGFQGRMNITDLRSHTMSLLAECDEDLLPAPTELDLLSQDSYTKSGWTALQAEQNQANQDDEAPSTATNAGQNQRTRRASIATLSNQSRQFGQAHPAVPLDAATLTRQLQAPPLMNNQYQPPPQQGVDPLAPPGWFAPPDVAPLPQQIGLPQDNIQNAGPIVTNQLQKVLPQIQMQLQHQHSNNPGWFDSFGNTSDSSNRALTLKKQLGAESVKGFANGTLQRRF